MKIKTQNYDNATVIGLQGVFDSDFTDNFHNELTNVISSQCKCAVIDMSEVGFIDSSAIEELLWARDYCNDSNCQLKLAGLDEFCSKILEITRLENEFERHNELADAVKSSA